MKFISYEFVFVGKINEIYILVNEKSNWEIPGYFKISRDTSRTKNEPGSGEVNPNQMPFSSKENINLFFGVYSLGLHS